GCVVPHLHSLYAVMLGPEEIPDDLIPAPPGAGKLIEVEAPPLSPRVGWCPSYRLAFPLGLLGQGSTLFAHKAQHVGLIGAALMLKFELLPAVWLESTTLGAGYFQLLRG